MQQEMFAMLRGEIKLDQNQLQRVSPEVAKEVTDAFQSIVNTIVPLGESWDEMIPKIPGLPSVMDIDTIVPRKMVENLGIFVRGLFTMAKNGFRPSDYMPNTLGSFGQIFSAMTQDIMAEPVAFWKMYTQFMVRHRTTGPVASLF